MISYARQGATPVAGPFLFRQTARSRLSQFSYVQAGPAPHCAILFLGAEPSLSGRVAVWDVGQRIDDYEANSRIIRASSFFPVRPRPKALRPGCSTPASPALQVANMTAMLPSVRRRPNQLRR